MQRIYQIEFTALLQKMTLAFKMECQIQVFWKRGSKVAETGKIPFRNCIAQFDKELKISCNMKFNTQKKMFVEKKTKFQIVIYTEKGDKNAGELVLDVAPFLNQKNKSKKYEMTLQKCPDKNAKLFFTLKGSILGEKSFDSISKNSLYSVDIHNLPEKDSLAAGYSSIQPSPSKILQNSTITENSGDNGMKKNKQKQIIPTTDRIMNKKNRKQESDIQKNVQIAQTDRTDSNTAQLIKKLQSENKKMRQQLKNKQKLSKQNEQLKRRLKDDDYQSCKEYKKKIQQGRKQIEHLQIEAKGVKKITQQIKKFQKDILKCKEQIMTIVNEANKYGPDVMEKIQQACGLMEY